MIPADQNRFSQRLRRLTRLDGAELQMVEYLCSRVQDVASDQTLVAEHHVPENVHILLDGWAARQKLRPNGSRQFTGLMVPGDICDIDGLHVARYDYSVVTLTRCRVAVVGRSDLLAMTDREPNILHALSWLGFVENAMLTTWLTMIGRGSARERVAHLLCELGERLEVVGLGRRDDYELPLTQEDIGDATGLTPVHVNRMLQSLKSAGLIASNGRRLIVEDLKQLQRAATFTPNYLHTEGMRPGGSSGWKHGGGAARPAMQLVGGQR